MTVYLNPDDISGIYFIIDKNLSNSSKFTGRVYTRLTLIEDVNLQNVNFSGGKAAEGVSVYLYNVNARGSLWIDDSDVGKFNFFDVDLRESNIPPYRLAQAEYIDPTCNFPGRIGFLLLDEIRAGQGKPTFTSMIDKKRNELARVRLKVFDNSGKPNALLPLRIGNNIYSGTGNPTRIVVEAAAAKFI